MYARWIRSEVNHMIGLAHFVFGIVGLVAAVWCGIKVNEKTYESWKGWAVGIVVLILLTMLNSELFPINSSGEYKGMREDCYSRWDC